MKESPYFEQAELMLRAIPHVAAETCFALKGGTAINLFVLDMPRLSVDIDLAYLPVAEPRETALRKISEALSRIAAAITKAIGGVTVDEIAYEDLIAAREAIIATLKNTLTDNEKAFLVSLKEGRPKWSVMGIAGIEKLPAIQWKLKNIQQMSEKKRAEFLNKLKRTLGA